MLSLMLAFRLHVESCTDLTRQDSGMVVLIVFLLSHTGLYNAWG